MWYSIRQKCPEYDSFEACAYWLKAAIIFKNDKIFSQLCKEIILEYCDSYEPLAADDMDNNNMYNMPKELPIKLAERRAQLQAILCKSILKAVKGPEKCVCGMHSAHCFGLLQYLENQTCSIDSILTVPLKIVCHRLETVLKTSEPSFGQANVRCSALEDPPFKKVRKDLHATPRWRNIISEALSRVQAGVEEAEFQLKDFLGTEKGLGAS